MEMGSTDYLCDTVFWLKVLQNFSIYLASHSREAKISAAAICFLRSDTEYHLLGYQNSGHTRCCFPWPCNTLLLMRFTEFALWFLALPFSLRINSGSKHAVSLLSMHYISNLRWTPFVFLQNNLKAFGNDQDKISENRQIRIHQGCKSYVGIYNCIWPLRVNKLPCQGEVRKVPQVMILEPQGYQQPYSFYKAVAICKECPITHTHLTKLSKPLSSLQIPLAPSAS